MKPVVAVISGGYSSEIIIARKSADMILKNIDTSLFAPVLVEITSESWLVIENEHSFPIDKNDFSFVKNGAKVKIDCAFITIHGTPGEDGKLQGYFDMINVPYINSDARSSALTWDKYSCNLFLSKFDIKIAQAVLLKSASELNLDHIKNNFNFPVFVKPNGAGSSFGVTKVNQIDEVKKAIELAFTESSDVIIEEGIEGTEVTCGIIQLKDKLQILPVTEIVIQGDYFDFAAKYEGKSEEITPARITAEETELVQAITEKTYKVLSLKGIARMDYIINKNGVYMIEVNTTPGMSVQSLVPQQVECAGLNLQSIFSELITTTLAK